MRRALLLASLALFGCRDLSTMEVVGDLGSGTGRGTIVLAQRATAPSGFITDATAVFVRDPATPTDNCTTEALANCTKTSCPPDATVPPVVIPADAGLITITGGTAPLSFIPSPDDNTYSPSSSPRNLWSGGEPLTATAPGRLAPPFTVALTAPATVTFTAPTGAITVPSGQDVSLSTASTATMTVGFSYVDSTGSNVSVACALTPSAGTLTFPAAALAAAPLNKKLTLSAITTAANTVTVGAWTIAFTATSNAAFPGGTNGISVTVQ